MGAKEIQSYVLLLEPVMPASAFFAKLSDSLRILLAAREGEVERWFGPQWKMAAGLAVGAIVVGFAAYGFTMGLRRAPLMGVYVAIKMPLLILLIVASTAFLNGIIGVVTGSGLGMRQSLLAQLLCFAICGLILGSLSPVVFFYVLNEPGYSGFLLTNVVIIAGAGIASCLQLKRVVNGLVPDSKKASRTLKLWLLSDAFVGTQLSYILRPFFGSPDLNIALLREDPFDGTFYEAVWWALVGGSGGGGERNFFNEAAEVIETLFGILIFSLLLVIFLGVPILILVLFAKNLSK